MKKISFKERVFSNCKISMERTKHAKTNCILFGGIQMSNRMNSKNPNHTNRNNNGLVEHNITSEDMKKYKNALDGNRSYISGTEELSSSGHRFGEKG